MAKAIDKLKGPGASGILLILGAIVSAFSAWLLVWLAQFFGGAEGLGEYSTLFAIATPLFVLGQLGLRTILLSASKSIPWKTYVTLQFSGLLISSAILLCYVLFFSSTPLSLGIAILLFKIFTSASDLYIARIQYSGNIFKVALLGLLSGFLILISTIIGALVWNTLTSAALGAAGGSLINYFLNRTIASRIPQPSHSTETNFRFVLQSSVPVTLAQLLASLLIYLPIFFLNYKSDLETVGIYAGVAYVITAANLLGSSLGKLLITPFRRTKESLGKVAVIRKTYSVSLKVSLVGIIVVIPFSIWGSQFFTLIYGPEFKLPYLALLFFALAALFTVLSYIQSVALNVLNKYNKVAVSFASACIASAAVGYFLFLVSNDGLIIGSAMAATGAFVRMLMMTNFRS